MNNPFDGITTAEITHGLSLLSVAFYLLMAAIPLVIAAHVRPGPSYWPAFTFVALASGIPGMYFAVILTSRLLDPGGQENALVQRCTTVLVMGFAIFLQGGALKKVREANAIWRAARRP